MIYNKLPDNNSRLNETNPVPIIQAVQATMAMPQATSPALDQTSYVVNHQKVQVNKAERDRGQMNNVHLETQPMLHK